MKKKDNERAKDEPRQFEPSPIPGAPTTPPEPLDYRIQDLRDNVFAALEI